MTDSQAHVFSPLLRELSAIPGLAGHEDAITRAMADRLAAHADEVTIDSIGNVIARFGAPGGASVALLAHMDTIGFLVNRVRADGMLGVVPVGGVNYKALPGAPVLVDGLSGVIGVRSQHQARDADALANASSVYIDVGRPEAVEITATVLYASASAELPGGCFSGPYMDNRAGCAVLLELARRLQRNPELTIYLIGTVQEESNCLGAFHALRAVQPDAALFIDGTVSHDTPDTAAMGQVKLGGGPVLTDYLYTRGGNGWHAHPGLRRHLKQIAAEHALDYQQDAVDGLISDAKTTVLLGLPSAIIGLPMRGKHAPLEIVCLDDLEAATQLLLHTLNRPLPDLRRGQP
ncbi:MAG: M20/M25/M40 family metallo-hydrolase [Anaerolineae bacterium]|nr:M20/M25/M40 family metallo-hydrolase [Anaerolineae bacterium]